MTMKIDNLKEKLLEIESISSEEWLQGLSERKRKELEFHDRHRDRKSMEALKGDTFDRFYGNKKYYSATGLSKEYVDNWIRESAKGMIFLDYACGNGVNAIKAAKAEAALAIGIDISPVSITNAREDAEREGVAGNTRFLQADAEHTRLPDESIDRIICSGMLHHLDLSKALMELRRILAPGGRILVVEALGYNPAIQLYRFLTPLMRTEWEKNHILRMKDVSFAGKMFTVCNIRYWHIMSILSPFMKPLQPVLDAMDKMLTRIPLVRLMSWIFTFELHKSQEVG